MAFVRPHRLRRRLTLSLAFVAVASGLAVAPDRVSVAAAGDGITAYISPPFVQGPPSSFGATIETFDSWTTCSSLPASQLGTFSGGCDVHDGATYEWGGAQTTSDTPTVQPGGAPSVFVSGPSSGALTLSFTTPVKYVGFWWSAGSPTDEVRFYDSSNSLIATFTTATLSSTLGGSIPTSNPFPGPTTLTAIDGTLYNRDYYWGRPYAYPTTAPTAIAYGGDVDRNAYAHAYLNVHASGTVAFSKVEFVGNPFEFDNVAASTSAQTPDPGHVFIESVLGNTVDYRANGGTGSMTPQTSTSATALSANTFTRLGHTFSGWSTTPSGTVAHSDGASYSFATGLTLHAQWTAIPYTVSFDTQGGSAVTSDSYTIGSTITLPSAPTRDGFTFDGWFATSSGGTSLSATYAPPSTGNITLHAQWTAIPYTVTYDTQGGSTISAQTTAIDSSLADPGTPTREGHTFAGWFTSATGGTPVTFPLAHGQTADFTLYAQWTRTNPSTTTEATTTAAAPTTSGTPTTTEAQTTTTTPDQVVLPATGGTRNDVLIPTLLLLGLGAALLAVAGARRRTNTP